MSGKLYGDDLRNNPAYHGAIGPAAQRDGPPPAARQLAAAIGRTFRSFDSDGNGTIDGEETAEFIKDLSVSALGKDRVVNWHQLTFDLEAARNATNAAMTGSQKAARRKAKEVTEPIFARFALRNMAILYPALHIQEVLRELIGGKAFWVNATEKRAGKGEVALVTTFCDQIKLDVKQQHLL